MLYPILKNTGLSSFFALSKASQGDVLELIKMIGLSNNKSKNIIALSKKLVEEKNGEVPNDYEYLITLPGVGRKTTNVLQ